MNETRAPVPCPPAPPVETMEQAWFDEPGVASQRRTSYPPACELVGEFLGDPLADSWLR